MEDNAKVFVFEKKEVFLIFVFVVIMSVTCFTLGLNLGKKLALEKSGVTESDVKLVEMKSTEEENAQAALEASEGTDEEKLKQLMDESKEKLNQELKDLSTEQVPAEKPEAAATTETAVENASLPRQEEPSTNPQAGKFTIQLGSYATVAEAKSFAEGFTVRGYSPIINEVSIPDKGTWFRVSLGLFDTIADAKAYIKKESSLFQSQDYVISEIK